MSLPTITEMCRQLAETTGGARICITRGAEGTVLWEGNSVISTPAPKVKVQDTVGAGDAFGLTLGLASGKDSQKTLAGAYRLGAYVASCSGATSLLPQPAGQTFGLS